MPSRSFARLLPYLKRLSTPASTDAELLDRFRTSRDEAAFAELVSRHSDMVVRVCWRVLGDSHAAQDAAQAVFLILARRAASIRSASSVPAWLHGTAQRVALNARRSRLRSRAAEWKSQQPEPAASRADPLSALTARELHVVVEQELRRLPQRFRLPVALCLLDGFSQEQAAQRIGCSLGALRGRLERGRRRLQDRLRKKGFTLAAALATVEASRGLANACSGRILSNAMARAAAAYLAGEVRGGTISTEALKLAQEEGVMTMGAWIGKVVLVVAIASGTFVSVRAMVAAQNGVGESPAADQTRRAAGPQDINQVAQAKKPESDEQTDSKQPPASKKSRRTVGVSSSVDGQVVSITAEPVPSEKLPGTQLDRGTVQLDRGRVPQRGETQGGRGETQGRFGAKGGVPQRGETQGGRGETQGRFGAKGAVPQRGETEGGRGEPQRGESEKAGTPQRRWRVGDRVEPGQLLVQLDDREARQEVSIRAAKLMAVQAEMRAADAAKKEADSRYERAKALVAVNAISQDELTERRLSKTKLDEDLVTKQAGVAIAEAEVRQANLRVELHQVRSPVRGVIAAVLRQPGEAVRKYEPILELKVVDED